MNRDTAFVASVAGLLLLLPLLVHTDGKLTTSIVITASLLMAILVADKRLNRQANAGLQYAPIKSPTREN